MNRTLIAGLQNRSNTIIRKGHLASQQGIEPQSIVLETIVFPLHHCEVVP